MDKDKYGVLTFYVHFNFCLCRRAHSIWGPALVHAGISPPDRSQLQTQSFLVSAAVRQKTRLEKNNIHVFNNEGLLGHCIYIA